MTLLFIYASFTQCDIFSQLLPNWLYNNVYSISATYTYSTVCNYSPQYTGFAVYICFHFHNVIFFHNDCTIHSTTMFTAYSQHIHTVLFTITLPSILTLLFIYASFTQCDIFSQLLHNWLYNNVYSISSTYTYGIVTITLPSILTLLFIYASFTQCDIFSQLLPNWLYNNVYSISATYTYSTVCNYSPQYTGFAVYICFPFHNVIFFHNDCTIHSTTMFTAYSQHIHTVLFTITLPSILTLLFIYAFLFTMWYFSTMTAQFTLQQCLQHILNISIQYCSQLHYPVYWLCCLYMLPLHNVTFFHNYCTIDSTTMSTAYPQHIRTVLLQLHYPVYWLCCLFMLPLHNVTFFHNYCPIDSTTMSTAYPQHIHIVLFATTPHSILALLFIYAFLFTMWYFSSFTE